MYGTKIMKKFLCTFVSAAGLFCFSTSAENIYFNSFENTTEDSWTEHYDTSMDLTDARKVLATDIVAFKGVTNEDADAAHGINALRIKGSTQASTTKAVYHRWLLFEEIDLTNHGAVNFSMDYFADNKNPYSTSNRFETNDGIKIELIKNGSESLVLFEGEGKGNGLVEDEWVNVSNSDFIDAAASSIQLKIGVSSVNYNELLFIDNISFSTKAAATPEPSSWALLLIALGGLSLKRKRVCH